MPVVHASSRNALSFGMPELPQPMFRQCCLLRSHTVCYGRNKATDDQQKENYRGPPKSVFLEGLEVFVPKIE